MLERYGIVTRETVLAEGVPGGFSALYGELSNLEMLGTARRGYFVEGHGRRSVCARRRGRAAAQPAARRRRVPRSSPRPIPPTRTARRSRGPSAPEGRRPARTAGAYLLLRNGDPLLYVERGGRGHPAPARARGPGAGRSCHAARRGARRGRHPEALDRASRRRARQSARASSRPCSRRASSSRGVGWLPSSAAKGARQAGLGHAAASSERPGLSLDRARGRHDPSRGAAPRRGAERPPDGARRGAEPPLADPRPCRRVRGRTLEAVEARGKHLLAHFSGDLVLHCHLGMNGRWFITADGRLPLRQSRGWCSPPGAAIASQRGGKLLRLITESRIRNDPGLLQLGPDLLAARIRSRARLRRLRQQRPRSRGRRRACSTSASSPASATRSAIEALLRRPGQSRGAWSRISSAEEAERLVERDRADHADLDRQGTPATPHLQDEPPGCPRCGGQGRRRGARATPTASPTGAPAASCRSALLVFRVPVELDRAGADVPLDMA